MYRRLWMNTIDINKWYKLQLSRSKNEQQILINKWIIQAPAPMNSYEHKICQRKNWKKNNSNEVIVPLFHETTGKVRLSCSPDSRNATRKELHRYIVSNRKLPQIFLKSFGEFWPFNSNEKHASLSMKLYEL